MNPRRQPEATTIDRKESRAQLALFLAQARPEKVAEVTAEDLCRRFNVTPRVAGEALARRRRML